MTIDEVKEDEWFKTRPEVVQQAILKLPPIQFYEFKETGKQCFIVSYDEPESGLLEDVTLTVQKTGVGGPLAEMGMGQLDTNMVCDVHLDDLKIYEK